MNVHKQADRSSFACTVTGCGQVYLYTCTLKKHVTKEHPSIFSKISEDKQNDTFYEKLKRLTESSESTEEIDVNEPLKVVHFAKEEVKVFKSKDHSCIRHYEVGQVDIEDQIEGCTEDLSKIDKLSRKCKTECAHHKSCPAMEVVLCPNYEATRCNCTYFCRLKYDLYAKIVCAD